MFSGRISNHKEYPSDNEAQLLQIYLLIVISKSFFTISLASLATVSACGASSSGSATGSDPISIEVIAAVICDSAPERMGADAELFTKSSWMCTFGEDRVRIDEYVDQEQFDDSRELAVSFYASTDPSKTLADFPFACGALWSAAFDFNETRDVGISLLLEADISADTC